ncbi:MAG: orotidine-5'-phosphate decarboxylase [Propionibacteriaceae bacterium]|jgi:orotidine-5'-phosphate decarboxylase
MITSYGERLEALVAERGPLCVGIDPHPKLLSSWGLPSDAAGLERCARGMIEALGSTVPVFKPQSAFFEAHGAAGIAVLERTLADIKAAGALCILDVKRGDIGSTMDAYAAAYLSDGSPLAADAVTLSPYLGFATLDGAIELADRGGRGVYVLALTSNPEGPQIQHARSANGRSVGQIIVDEAARRNGIRRGSQAALGPVGIVVGATIGQTGTHFAALNGSILSPGIGAQGASAADIPAVFGEASRFVLPSSSREVMSAGPTPAALRRAATQVLGEMKAALGLR